MLHAFVESLPWNWLANLYGKCLMLALEHFVWEVEHCYIYLELEGFADVCYAIEFIRVLTFEMDRNDISLVFDTLGYECLFPFKVLYLAIDLA